MDSRFTFGNNSSFNSDSYDFTFGNNDTNMEDTSFFNYTKTYGFSFGGNTENKPKEKKISNNDKEYLAHKYTKAKNELDYLKKRKIDFKDNIITYQIIQNIEKIIKLQEQKQKIYDEMNNIKNNIGNNNT